MKTQGVPKRVLKPRTSRLCDRHAAKGAGAVGERQIVAHRQTEAGGVLLQVLGHLRVRVLSLEKMLENKAEPRPDDVGGAKDRADLAALRAIADRR